MLMVLMLMPLPLRKPTRMWMRERSGSRFVIQALRPGPGPTRLKQLEEQLEEQKTMLTDSTGAGNAASRQQLCGEGEQSLRCALGERSRARAQALRAWANAQAPGGAGQSHCGQRRQRQRQWTKSSLVLLTAPSSLALGVGVRGLRIGEESTGQAPGGRC